MPNIEAAVEVSIDWDDEHIPLMVLQDLRDRLYAVVAEAFPNNEVTLLRERVFEGWS